MYEGLAETRTRSERVDVGRNGEPFTRAVLDLVLEMRTNLPGDRADQTQAFDGMPVRILIQSEVCLLLDLVHLGDQVFELHSPESESLWRREHSETGLKVQPSREQESRL